MGGGGEGVKQEDGTAGVVEEGASVGESGVVLESRMGVRVGLVCGDGVQLLCGNGERKK